MRFRRWHRFYCELLEARCVLAANLVAHWSADALSSQLTDNATVSEWLDSTQGLLARGEGSPTFRQDAYGGRAAIQFGGVGDVDSFRVNQRISPMSGVEDFSIVVAFATQSTPQGASGPWYQNTGLVDGNSLGFTADWGVSLNAAGQVSAGVGGGFGQPAQTIYSQAAGLNDGALHFAVFTRAGTTLSLSVDGGPSVVNQNASGLPRAKEVDARIGILANNALPYAGDIAEVQIYHGALTSNETVELVTGLRQFYSNTRPIATADFYAMPEDGLPLTVARNGGVLVNDSDGDGDPLEALLLSAAEQGVLELSRDGSFVYAPFSNFSGDDTFVYAADDGVQPSLPTGVVISVAPVNDAPIASGDQYFVAPDQLLAVSVADGVLANDSDVDGDSLGAVLQQPPQHGTVQLRTDGSFEYRPKAGFQGSDSFVYRLSDGQLESLDSSVEIVVDTLAVFRQVVINELHTSPDESARPLEFIELFNQGSAAVDLSDWTFSSGVSYTFVPGTTIPGGGYLVIAQSPSELQAKFDVVSQGPWEGRLNGDGETVELRSSGGALVDRVSYGQGFPWPTVSDAPGPSLQLLHPQLDNDLGGSWRGDVPTPGRVNRVLTTHVAPLLRQVSHEPQQPKSGEPVAISIKGTDADGVASLTLQYQIVEPGEYVRAADAEYETGWTTVPMNDNGVDGDPQAHDDTFTAVLPGSLQVHRRLVRYRFVATDTLGDVVQVPYADDPAPNFAYFVYDGIPDWTGASQPGVSEAITYTSDTMDSLPAYHLIADETDVTRSQYNSSFNNRQFLGTVVYDGVVYDHIVFKNRGQNSTYVTGKNKWKLLFNSGHEFQPRDDKGRPWSLPVKELNLGTAASPWARPNRGLAAMDEALAFKFFNLAGVPAPRSSAIQWRVIDNAVESDPTDQYNSDLWGLYLAYEDPGGRFLDEHGLADGNLYRMQGGSGELRHQGLGLPSSLAMLREFTSTRTGYNKRNPIQPVEWWRDNVDLDMYYSYRAVIEALNHSDLRDQENSLQYYNAETGKWAQLPWDLDLLYEEFDRWGPDGVQNASPLEQVRLALGHEELLIEFQARLREMQDLLFNPDQAWQAVDEYARYVERFADVDRAMWNYNPRTSAAHKGYFYKSQAPYDGGAAGQVRRALTSPDFEGMINWVKAFIVDGGFGGSQLKVLHQDDAIPATPVLSRVAIDDAITNLAVRTTPFADPQGADTFANLEWRIAEVTDVNAPAFDANEPVHYEVTPTWHSGPIGEFNDTLRMDPAQIEVGRAYRVRVRMQDSSGRWSHWSEPIQFVPTAADSAVHAGLRVSEINYHPADPSVAEMAAGYADADEFEFIELMNVSPQTLDLRSVSLQQITINGQTEGVSFDFDGASITSLRPNDRVIVVENEAAFVARYGTQVPIAGQWDGQLGNSNELITLSAFATVIQQFRYDDAWYPGTDGEGATLQIVDVAAADLGSWSQAVNWRASAVPGGTPGTDEFTPGDANRDGRFDSADLVLVFQAGKYEDSFFNNSNWEEGDWNGDGDFTSRDLVLAFQAGSWSANALDHETDELSV